MMLMWLVPCKYQRIVISHDFKVVQDMVHPQILASLFSWRCALWTGRPPGDQPCKQTDSFNWPHYVAMIKVTPKWWVKGKQPVQ